MGQGFMKMEYQQTCDLAGKLSELASDTNTVADSSSSMISALNTGWQGISGTDMDEVVHLWMSKQKKIAEKMNAVSGQIKMVADALKAADDDSAQRNLNA